LSSELMPQLNEIFKDVFDSPDLQVDMHTTASDVAGWDSLSNINLVFAIEQEFNIKFALGEIQDLKNVGEMAALIEKKTRRKG